MEQFPYIDSLWLGEGFDYDESPDYGWWNYPACPSGYSAKCLAEAIHGEG